jgi:hypothetical protein
VLPFAVGGGGRSKRDESGSVDEKHTWKPLISFIPFYNSFQKLTTFFFIYWRTVSFFVSVITINNSLDSVLLFVAAHDSFDGTFYKISESQQACITRNGIQSFCNARTP